MTRVKTADDYVGYEAFAAHFFCERLLSGGPSDVQPPRGRRMYSHRGGIPVDFEQQAGAIDRVMSLLGESLDARELISIREDLDAGDVEVAYHRLCTQLVESSVPVSTPLRDVLELVGRGLGVDSRYWTLLTPTAEQS